MTGARRYLEFVKDVGEGGMGTVRLFRHRVTGYGYAEKRAKPTFGKRNFLLELELWAALPESSNLLACRFFRSTHDELSIYTDFVEGGSLRDSMQRGSIDALRTTREMVSGLCVLHQAGYVHKDIKPGNVLVSLTGEVKIADFGLARAKYAGGVPSGDGSVLFPSGGADLRYCSPEQFQRRDVSRKTDIWSLGATVLEMVVGKRHWRVGPEAREHLAELPSTTAPELRALIADCLNPEPSLRPSAAALAARLDVAVPPLADSSREETLDGLELDRESFLARIGFLRPQVRLATARRLLELEDQPATSDLLFERTRLLAAVQDWSGVRETVSAYMNVQPDPTRDVPARRAHVLLNYGRCLWAEATPEASILIFLQAHDLLERVATWPGGGVPAAIVAKWAEAAYELGQARLTTGRHKAAMAHFSHAASICQSVAQRDEHAAVIVVAAHAALAQALRQTGDDSAARGCEAQAWQLLDAHELLSGDVRRVLRGQIRLAQGLSALRSKQIEDASRAMDEAESYFRDCVESPTVRIQLALVLSGKSVLLSSSFGTHERAHETAQKAYAMCIDVVNRTGRNDALEHLTDILFALSRSSPDEQTAASYARRAAEVVDLVQPDQAHRKFPALMLEYGKNRRRRSEIRRDMRVAIEKLGADNPDAREFLTDVKAMPWLFL